jgi:hypothetical protein
VSDIGKINLAGQEILNMPEMIQEATIPSGVPTVVSGGADGKIEYSVVMSVNRG